MEQRFFNLFLGYFHINAVLDHLRKEILFSQGKRHIYLLLLDCSR